MTRLNVHVRRHVLALSTLLVLPYVSGCEPTADADESAAAQPATAESVEGSAAEAGGVEEDVGSYALEEWGLVRFVGADVELTTSLPLPRRVPPSRIPDVAAPRKPVIYLFPDDAWDASQPIAIRVGLPSGQLNEAWPPPSEQDATGFGWTVTVGSDTCNGDLAPLTDSAHCAPFEAPMICEAEDMRRYLRDDAPCITMGDTRTPALIYNGYLPELDAPARVTESGLVVGQQPIAVLWWRTDGTVYRVSDLEPGAEVELADTSPAGNATWLGSEFEQDLTETLRSTGMTRVTDFVDAWRPHLVGSATQWQIFGFYDPAIIDELLPLQLVPSPSDTTRVLAFTVEPTLASGDISAELEALLGAELGADMAHSVLGDAVTGSSIEEMLAGIPEDELMVGEGGIGRIGTGPGTGTPNRDGMGTGGLGQAGIGGSGGIGGPIAPASSVELVSWNVGPGVDEEITTARVRMFSSRFAPCFEESVSAEPGATTEVNAEFAILMTGRVSRVQTSTPDSAADGALPCVDATIERMVFDGHTEAAPIPVTVGLRYTIAE